MQTNGIFKLIEIKRAGETTGKNKTKLIIPIIDKIEITIAAVTIGYSTPI